jgi:hypothetical protein
MNINFLYVEVLYGLYTFRIFVYFIISTYYPRKISCTINQRSTDFSRIMAPKIFFKILEYMEITVILSLIFLENLHTQHVSNQIN